LYALLVHAALSSAGTQPLTWVSSFHDKGQVLIRIMV